VWQDRAGNRYTSQWISSVDRRVLLLRRRKDGRVDILFDESRGDPRRSQSSVESVGGMAFAADGSLFFTNGGVLRRLAPDGRVTKMYDGGAASSLRGLAAASDGRVLVADMGAKAVLAIGKDGRVSTSYRETTGWLPTAVALAGGRLLVLEANADPYQREERVRVIQVEDGRARVIAAPGHPPAAQATEWEAGGRGVRTALLASLAVSAAFIAAWWLGRLRKPAA
jgi:hypothetical protein